MGPGIHDWALLLTLNKFLVNPKILSRRTAVNSKLFVCLKL